jgi:hypothetical protein
MQHPVDDANAARGRIESTAAASIGGAVRFWSFAFAGVWVAVVSAFALAVSHSQFGGYDLSPLIDFQYRLAVGQRPGADFVFTFPLTLALLMKFAAGLPLSWFSLVWINLGVFAACAFLVTWSWPSSGDRLKFAGTLGALALPVLYTGHIWHSALSQMIAAPYLLLAIGLFHDAGNRMAKSFVLALCAGLLFFSKQNLGPPMVIAVCGAACVGAVVRKTEPSRAALFVGLNVAGVGIVAALIMAALGVGPAALAHSFTDVLGRAKQTEEQLAAIELQPMTLYVVAALVVAYVLLRLLKLTPKGELPIPFILAVMVAAWMSHMATHQAPFAMAAVAGLLLLWLSGLERTASSRWMRTGLLLAALAAGLVAVLTDWDTIFNHVTVLMVALLLLADLPGRKQQMVVATCMLLAVGGAAAGGEARTRMRTVGDFWSAGPLDEAAGGYFQGLKLGRELSKVRSELPKAIAEAHGGAVFCGPRIEFCYADSRIASPHGLPLWWHPGTSYPTTAEKQVIDTFKADRFAAVIFRKGDTTRVPEPILEFIGVNYEKAAGYAALDVYLRKR